MDRIMIHSSQKQSDDMYKFGTLINETYSNVIKEVHRNHIYQKQQLLLSSSDFEACDVSKFQSTERYHRDKSIIRDNESESQDHKLNFFQEYIRLSSFCYVSYV